MEETESFLSDPLFLKYEKFVAHIRKNYFRRKEKWTMHVRNDLKLPTNNNQTNNLCESSFRILKDILFQRIRCFNLPDLTEMLLTDILILNQSLLMFEMGDFLMQFTIDQQRSYTQLKTKSFSSVTRCTRLNLKLKRTHIIL